MKTFYSIMLVLILSAVLFVQNAEAQLTGEKTIKAVGGDYTSFTAAITDLNTIGVGAGGVTFNVEAGFTESITAPLLITATGTSSNLITFQKDKATTGDNPKITRTDAGLKTTTSLGGDGDAIIQINGSDYMIFDGIDVQSGNTTIEYGYYTYKPSGTDGCQNVIIKNSTITMIKSTAANVVIGIHISNGPTALAGSTNGGVTVTDYSGRNENIEVSNNLIQNVNQGVYIQGYNHTVSPYDFYDQNVTIGKAGAGNTIQNFQWASTAGSSYGIYSSFCNNFNASYNYLNNTAGGGAASTSFFYAIYSSYTKAATITYSYNTFNLTSTGTRAAYAFGNNAGDANSTFYVHHNTLENCVHGSSGVFSAFNNGVTGITLNLFSNTVRNNTINTGSSTMFTLGSVDTAYVYDNIVSNNTIAGGTSTHSAFTISGSGVVNMYSNSIYGYTSTALAPVYAISISGGKEVKVYNNLIYDFETMYSHATTDAIRGISITSTTATSNIGIYYNTIYLDASTGGADFWTSCIFHTYNATATTAVLDMRNNILVNASTPSGVGKASAFRRSAATNLNNYSTLSNYNLLYAGTPGASNLIHYNGTTSYPTLADFKTAVGPTRETNSVSGDPGFTSSTNLIPDGTNANSWTVYNNGTHIEGITTDYAGNTRPLTVALGTPDIGAYEFGQPSVNPTPVSFAPVSGQNIIAFNGLPLFDVNFSNLGGITDLTVNNYQGKTPPGSGGEDALFMNGYFVITQTGGAGYTYDITYTYSESQLGTVSAEEKVRLAKSDDNGATWVPYLTAGTEPGQYELNITNNTIKVFGLTAFSTFTITDSDSPLPVQLTSFTSSLNGRDIRLTWKTESEINNAGFDIERSLSGSTQWVKAGYVAGKGNSSSTISYTFEDKKLNSGKYDYRLKQIDNNGNFEYHKLSNTVEVGLPTKFELSQNYPNPFNPVTKIDFSLPLDSKVSIKLYDITGREVKTLVNEARTAGYYTVQFNASDLSSGTYFYRIMTKSSGADYIMTKKMVLVK